MKCNNCGNELPKNALFCDNCGQAITLNDDDTDEIICGNCGAVLEIGMEFCGECGVPVNTSDSISGHYIFCGNCGAKMRDNLQVCTNCGEPVSVDNTFNSKEHSKKKNGIVIIVLIVIILALGGMILGYLLYSNSSGNNDREKLPDAVPSTAPVVSPDSTAMPIESDIPDSTANIDKLDTYYVVNCSTNISLRESPNVAAKSLVEIPLGDPVSYVESAQNGFAKVIYNGITGYALQSYLSNNTEDVKRSKTGATTDSNNSVGVSSSNSAPVNNQNTHSVVSHPTYNTYVDSEYKFNCKYPTHFTETYSGDSFVRHSYKAPGNTATLNICGSNNSANLSVETIQNNFKSSYPGTVDYENRGNDWCVCRTYKDGIYHYGYFKVKDGMIRGFELHFDGNYYTVYDGYVNDIYNSLDWR